ncbi:tetrahydrofolate synthase [Actinomycetota bacterium]|nr:tetrahydrofolate synthase [Actinomycetota bacterium]
MKESSIQVVLSDIERVLFAKRPENDVDLKLEKVLGALELLGNPQDDFKAIHITGTNGKTSTTKFIAAGLESLGYKTATFTSPHLKKVTERMTINSMAISDEEFVDLYLRVAKTIEPSTLSFFEYLVVLAFKWFSEQKVDYAVVEVGLGGRYDATNVLGQKVAAVFTPIDIDHTQFLGNTIEEIAHEKAGIIKPGVQVFSAPQVDAVSKILNKESPLESIFYIKIVDGTYLEQNKALAKAVVEGVTGRILAQNALDVQVQGRLQKVGTSPDVIIDAAHNPHGAKGLVEALKSFNYPEVVAVVMQYTDKETAGFLEILAVSVDKIVCTTSGGDRSRTPQELADIAVNYKDSDSVLVAKDVQQAVELAKQMASKSGLVLVTGSVAGIGQLCDF